MSIGPLLWPDLNANCSTYGSIPIQVTSVYVTPRTRQDVTGAKPLLRRLSDPYVSIGYQGTLKPPEGSWSTNDLAGTKIAGLCPKDKCAIKLYRATNYDAIYIAHMPAAGGGTEEEQFSTTPSHIRRISAGGSC